MSTKNDPATGRERGRRINPLVVPMLIAAGVAILVVALAQGDPQWGVTSVIIMWGLAAAVFFGSRHSDTIALLADDVNEERHVQIHRHAAILTLNILLAVMVVATVIDIANGGDGTPYFWLLALGGGTYVVLVLLLNRRN